jgi:hypothetical protein
LKLKIFVLDYKYIYTGLTRISDLAEKDFEVKEIEKTLWETGDYVACKIIKKGSDSFKLELTNGRMRGAMGAEKLVGVLGERHATLEATGTWKKVGRDNMMDVLTASGLLGKLTSKSVYIQDMMRVQYLGHILRKNKKITMDSFVKPVEAKKFKIPIVMFVGTSMSSGKTTSARIVTNIFKIANLKVVGAKLTGAGRYKDILAIKDVGAEAIFDFVDAGLPSSICPREIFIKKLKYLKNLISSVDADIAVIEIGASPLEPYNGDIAIESIREHVKCTILSASDPYAVLGLRKAFNIKPDIVTGVSTNTYAGRELVEKLCNVKALNLIDPRSIPSLKRILNAKLDLSL